MFRTIILGLLYIIIKLYFFTWRYSFNDNEVFDKNGIKFDKERFILAGSHGFMLPYIAFCSFKGFCTLASQSNDGELITGFLNKLGYNVVRGSSSKGGVRALLDLKRMIITENLDTALTIDGPRGPRFNVKPGVIFLAKVTGCKVVLCYFSCKHYIRFNSWDKMILPLPFSKINMCISEPVVFSPDRDEFSIECDRLFLEGYLRGWISASTSNML